MYMSIAALGLAWVTIEQSIHHRIVGRDSSYGLAAVYGAPSVDGWMQAVTSISIKSYLNLCLFIYYMALLIRLQYRI